MLYRAGALVNIRGTFLYTHIPQDMWKWLPSEHKHRKRASPHLLDVVIQGDNGEGGGEIGTARDSCAQRSRFRDESMISGHLEVRRLIVLIKHLNVEIGKRWERVSIILLRLEKRMPWVKSSWVLTLRWNTVVWNHCFFGLLHAAYMRIAMW